MEEGLERCSGKQLLAIKIACEEKGEAGNRELLRRVEKVMNKRKNDQESVSTGNKSGD